MSTLPKVIYVMGPPGAGKGTQAENLAQELEYHRFSTGDAFRAISRQDTELGRRVKETIDAGLLAPAEMAAEVVIDAVKEHVKGGSGLIFDGTPRTVKEAALVDKFFEKEGYGRPMAILLDVDKNEMIRRNSQRRFCLDIDGDFPVINEADEKKCADLGGHVGKRPDDDPDKMDTRWSEFQKNTAPVIAKYEKEGILQRIDGLRSIEDVHKSVMELIDSLRK